MSDYRWWVIMAAWALFVIWLVCWLYKRVKREEPKYAMPVRVITGNDVRLPRDPMKYEGRDLTSEQQELLREQNSFNARRDNAYLERARRAESLGFIDPEDAA